MIVDGRVVHEVDYAHPPERVWRALVDSAELSIWLMATDFVAEVGHRFTLQGGPELGQVQGEVLHVEPPRLLRCRWSGTLGDTVVEFALSPSATGTHLRLEHSGWDEEHLDWRRQFHDGWDTKFSDELLAVLDK